MPTLTPLPAKPKTLSGKVYLQLKKRIAEGKLPPRTRLLTEHLARDLGVSATPLREALRMLHKDGLVSLTPNRGAIVTEQTREELEDLFQVRQALETLTIRLTTAKASAADLEKLDAILDQARQALAAGDIAAWLVADEQFHRFFIACAGSRVLPRVLEPVMDCLRRYLANAKSMAHAPAALQEHAAMVAAVKAGDADRAAQLMTQHLKSSLAERLEAMDQQRPSP